MNNSSKIIEILEKKKIEMEQCDHLFIKQEEGYWVGGFHSSDYEYTPCTVKCLKCGLTNYHINMDSILREKYNLYIKILNPLKYYWFVINDEIFKKQFENNIYKLISNEVLPATDSSYLYQVAKQIKPDACNDIIFEIMKNLYELEKKGVDINIEEQINNLKGKYSNSKVKQKRITT